MRQQTKHPVQNVNTLGKALREQQAIIDDLVDKVNYLVEVVGQREAKIQRVETFNNESVPELKNNMRMQEEDKLLSIKNACAILPPNLKVGDRHTTGNVSALVGFKVTPDMITRAMEI